MGLELDLARALRILADRTLDEDGDEGSDSSWAHDGRSHLPAAARLSEQLAGELHLAMDDLQYQVQPPPPPAGVCAASRAGADFGPRVYQA